MNNILTSIRVSFYVSLKPLLRNQLHCMASFSYELEVLIVMKNEWYIDKEFTLASRSLNSTSICAPSL